MNSRVGYFVKPISHRSPQKNMCRVIVSKSIWLLWIAKDTRECFYVSLDRSAGLMTIIVASCQEKTVKPEMLATTLFHHVAKMHLSALLDPVCALMDETHFLANAAQASEWKTFYTRIMRHVGSSCDTDTLWIFVTSLHPPLSTSKTRATVAMSEITISTRSTKLCVIVSNFYPRLSFESSPRENSSWNWSLCVSSGRLGQ